MKTTLRLTIAALGLAVLNLSAQTPPVLGLHLYAGLSITGAVGNVYSIEYVTDLAQTNNPSVWRCLEFLQLPASPYLWADKSTPATGTRFYRAGVFVAPTNMVFIPPGTFRMGSPTNEVGREPYAMGPEGPQTWVTITRGFWMSRYEVTQEEYQVVMGNNPSNYHEPASAVENVFWSSATNYCGQITRRERAAGRIPTNCVYRLPTEAEWEYACRAGTSTPFSFGEDPGYTNATQYGWYYENSPYRPHQPGLKLPNPWGLYDIHGNVFEWCEDFFDIYRGGTATDRKGPDNGLYHVVRSGVTGIFLCIVVRLVTSVATKITAGGWVSVL